MCEPEHYDFGDLNLDFLDSVPSVQGNRCLPKGVCSPSKITTNLPSEQSNVSQAFEIDRRKYKVKELAKQIATTDFCIEQIKTLEKERNALQEQLSEFKGNADSIRQLYIQESEERKRLALQTKELSTKCEKLQTEIATKTYLLDQLESQLDDINHLPVEYNELLVGYLRLCNKFEEEAKVQLPNAVATWADKLRQYCKQKSIRIPLSLKRSPKKRPSKNVNSKKDACIQCEVWKTAPVEAPSFLQTVVPKQMYSQGTQYISTTTTRSTSTSTNITRRTVGTNFPERSAPQFEDVMKEMLKWNIQPLSPICETHSDTAVPTSVQTTKSIGTCTFICNIHRQVDYIGSNQGLLTSIKLSNSRPPSRVMLESIKHEMITPPPTISSTPTATNFARSTALGAINCSSLGATTTTTFEDLWQVFGQMVLGLLSSRQREGDSVIQNLITDSRNACNQEEFYRWLRVVSADAEQETQQCSESSGAAATHSIKDANQQNIIGTNPVAECIWKQRNNRENLSDVNLPMSDCSRNSSFGLQKVIRENEQYLSEYHNKKSKTGRSEKIVNEILKLFSSAETTEERKRKIHKLIKKKNKPQKDRKFIDKKRRDINEDVKSTILSYETEQTSKPENKIFTSTNIDITFPEGAKTESNLEEYKENEAMKLSSISEDGNKTKKFSADVNDMITSLPVNDLSENAVDFLMQLSNISPVLDKDMSILQSVDDKPTCLKTSLTQIQHNNFATKVSALNSEKFNKNKQNFMSMEDSSGLVGGERENADDGRDEKLKIEDIVSNERTSQPQVIYQRVHERDYRVMTDCSHNDRAAKKLLNKNVSNNNEPDGIQYALNDVQLSQDRLYQKSMKSEEYKNFLEKRAFKTEIKSNVLRSQQQSICHNKHGRKDIAMQVNSIDNRVEEEIIKIKDYAERVDASPTSLYQESIKSPEYKNCQEEVTYKNEIERNELTSQPHIIYHKMDESEYKSMSEISNNEIVVESSMKANIKKDGSLANQYPLNDVQLSQHNLYQESKNYPQQNIYKTEIESKELSPQAKIIYRNMPESVDFREGNSIHETVEIMKSCGKFDHSYHQQQESFQTSNFLNGSPECIILQPSSLDINQQLYTQNQCYRLDAKAINDSITYQTIPLVYSNDANCENEEQKFHEISQINSRPSEVLFGADLLSQQAEDYESPQAIGELIEAEEESPPVIGEFIEADKESQLIGELIETNKVIQGNEDKPCIGKYEDSAQMVANEVEKCSLECSEEVVDVKYKTIPAEDQVSARDDVIVDVWDTVNECNLVIDECEKNTNTKKCKDVDENAEIVIVADIEKSSTITVEQETRKKSTTPTFDSAAVQFITPNKQTGQSNNVRVPSIVSNFSPTTHKARGSEIFVPHTMTTPNKEMINDTDEHQVFENYLCRILNEVAPRNVSPISIILSSPTTSSSLLQEKQPKKRGRKRKNEMCSPPALSPAVASAEPVASSKRSERLRMKRKTAESILDTNSTLVRNTLGKYTTKRAYKKRQTICETVEKVVATVNPSTEGITPKPEINLGFFRERFEALEAEVSDTLKKENENEFNVAEPEGLSSNKGSIGKFVEAKVQQNQDDNDMEKVYNFQEYQNCDNVHQSGNVNTQSLTTISPASPSQPCSSAHYDSPASPTLPLEHEATALITLHRRSPALLEAVKYDSPPSTTQPTYIHSNSDSTGSPMPESPASPPAPPFPALPDSPASPPPPPNLNKTMSSPSRICSPIKIPFELDPAIIAKTKNSLIQQLTINYREDLHKLIKASGGKKATTTPLQKSLCQRLQDFLKTTDEADDVDTSVVNLMNEMHCITQNLSEILNAIIVAMQTVTRPEAELGCPVADVPPKYLGKQHRRMSFVLRHLQALQPFFIVQLMGQIESTIFNFDTSANLSLDAILNLTQLYLLAISIQLPMISVNPARLFVAKCLYFYNQRAIPMIYEVLCCFPTTLPHREEYTYDRSDALITVIQHVLMSTKYDMDKRDLRTRELLSKLRFEYHFEPFKPERTEVLANLVDKIKAGKVENLPYAFALFCKRLPQIKVEENVIQAELLPLTHEYYRHLDESDAHDVSIMCLLETISMIIKPFNIETDIDMYLRIFSRFLNATDRPRIQETAVQAILRCQRFGYVNCFYALQLFRPRHQLQAQTKAMLQTFVYRKAAKFWKTVNKTASFFIECSSN